MFFLIKSCFIFSLCQSALFYILRLPCKYHAEFSEQQNNKYSTTSIYETLYNITASDCIFRCTFVPGCKSINHKEDETVCELLTTAKKSLDDMNGWKYYTTDYGKLNHGPHCEEHQPCTYQTQCFDTCEVSNFRCEPFPSYNIARAKPILLDTVYSGEDLPASRCVDGNWETACHSDSASNPWLKIDFQAVFRIYAVNLVARMVTPWRVKNLSIYIGFISDPSIGRQNDFFRLTDTDNFNNWYLNNSFKFTGRYLFAFGAGSPINLMEIEVFGKIEE